MTATRPVVRRGLSLGRVFTYGFLIVGALWFLMPIYMLVVTSLKGFDEVTIARMWALPIRPTIEAYVSAWTEGKIGAGFINSVRITVPASIISSVMGSLNGYIFAKWKFKGSNVLFLLFLFGMFLPYQGVLIPMVQMLSKVGLYGQASGLIFVHCIFGIPICALMFRSYYAGVPDELIDAAKLKPDLKQRYKLFLTGDDSED